MTNEKEMLSDIDPVVLDDHDGEGEERVEDIVEVEVLVVWPEFDSSEGLVIKL